MEKCCRVGGRGGGVCGVGEGEGGLIGVQRCKGVLWVEDRVFTGICQEGGGSCGCLNFYLLPSNPITL